MHAPKLGGAVHSLVYTILFLLEHITGSMERDIDMREWNYNAPWQRSIIISQFSRYNQEDSAWGGCILGRVFFVEFVKMLSVFKMAREKQVE